jgi:hypothetical protein
MALADPRAGQLLLLLFFCGIFGNLQLQTLAGIRCAVLALAGLAVCFFYAL